jgi:exosortase
MPKAIPSLTKIDWIFLVAVVAMLPLLYIEAQLLWLNRHFQFFPIAHLATLLFLFFHGKTDGRMWPVRYRVGIAVFTLAIILALVSTLLFSPWLAQLAAIVLLTGWLLLRFLGNKASEIVTWILPLIVCLPLPSGIDGRLVRRIQILSSRSASDLLDVLGLPHLLTGNVITIKSKPLFIDETCSGADSLYALAAVATIIIAFNRLSLISSVLLLISVPLWAWAGNLTRLTVIAIMLDRFEVDLSYGWAHTLLGLLIFAGAFLGLLSMSEMIGQIFKKVPFNPKNTNHSKFNQFYNLLVGWPNSRPDARQANPTADTQSNAAEVPVSKKYAMGLIVGALFVLFFSIHGWLRGPLIGRTPDNYLHIDYEQVEAAFRQDDLPSDLNGMTFVDFEIHHRPNSKLFYGEYSTTWTYLRNSQKIIISLDFPFPGFHALEACYLGSGCEMINDRNTIDVTEYARSVGASIRSVEEVRLNHVELGECYLLYAEFDKDGKDVWRLGNQTTGSFLARAAFALQMQPVTFQLQLHSTDAHAFSASDRDELAKTLTDCARLLAPKLQQFYD